jgi:hypothetical protein
VIVPRVKCDNPSCMNTSTPEWVSPNGKQHKPPYGWLYMKGYFMGCGPNIEIEVCGIDCLGPAVAHAEAEDRNQ